jgi:hypothetical protein
LIEARLAAAVEIDLEHSEDTRYQRHLDAAQAGIGGWRMKQEGGVTATGGIPRLR